MNWVSKIFKSNKPEKSIAPNKSTKEYFEGYDTFKVGQQLTKDAVLDKSLSAERRRQKTIAALEFLDQAIQKGYDEAEAFALRVSVLRDLDYDIDALNDYNICIDKNPNKASYYYARALTKQFIYDYSGSLADFKEAIRLSKLDNDDTRYWNDYALQTGFNSATEKYKMDMQFLLQAMDRPKGIIESLQAEKNNSIQRRK